MEKHPAKEKSFLDFLTESAVAEAISGIRKGYPWKAVHEVQESLDLPDPEFARIIGASGKTLSRARKSRAALDPVYSDRVYRAAKILALAIEVFEDRVAAVQWLRRPQIGLSGKIPLELLDTEPGAGAVEVLLNRIEYGVVA